jgi:hypothetical protein
MRKTLGTLALLAVFPGCASLRDNDLVFPACLAVAVPVALLAHGAAPALAAVCTGGTAMVAYDHKH